MRVVVGVGGGIAAYKAAELVRALQKHGHEVQVVMTRAAREFIQPLTFAALTGQKVVSDLFSQESSNETLSSAVEHIALAQNHDAMIVAPATADLLAKLAHGLADDFLTTLYLAFTGPVLLAPAMNTAMWEHPATKANLQTLRARGCFVVDPDEGWLACGTVGAGRFPDPDRILAEFDLLAEQRKDFNGESILITARPNAGGARPRPLHQQSLEREDGVRHRGSCGPARRARHPDIRSGKSNGAERRASDTGADRAGHA